MTRIWLHPWPGDLAFGDVQWGRSVFRRLPKDERGAAAAEYALILAIAGAGITFAATDLSDAISGAMTRSGEAIAALVEGGGGGQSGGAPGNSGDAPGNSGDAPGPVGDPPGPVGDPPGKGGDNPGHGGGPPGKGGGAPGKKG